MSTATRQRSQHDAKGDAVQKVMSRGPTALVTGASSGAGEAFARALAARGCSVILVADREDRLVDLATELEWVSDAEVHVVPIDLRRADASDRVRKVVEAKGLRVDILVHGADLSTDPFLSTDAHRLQDAIRVDVAACVGMTRQFLPAMVERGNGVVITLSSPGALQPQPGHAVSAASNAFLRSFAASLRMEQQTGVRVIACAPDTDIGCPRTTSRRDPDPLLTPRTPEHIAIATLQALDHSTGRRPTHVPLIGQP